jgi:hypothetical protein
LHQDSKIAESGTEVFFAEPFPECRRCDDRVGDEADGLLDGVVYDLVLLEVDESSAEEIEISRTAVEPSVEFLACGGDDQGGIAAEPFDKVGVVICYCEDGRVCEELV